MNERKRGLLVFLLLLLFLIAGTITASILLLELPVKQWLTPFEQTSEDPDTAVVIMEDEPVFQDGILLSPLRSADDLLDEPYSFVFFSMTMNSKVSRAQMQGACTDGNFIWLGWSKPYKITKIHIPTGKVLSKTYTEAEWQFGHINDMTYNPRTNQLLVVSYDSSDYSTSGNLAVLDADTLAFEKMVYLKNKDSMLAIHGIAYDRLHNRYVAAAREGRGSRYVLLDENLQYIDTILTTRQENYIIQGIETDGNLIYRALWNENESCHIAVYDYEGNFVKLMNLSIAGSEQELEDIMYDWHGNWFINLSDHANYTDGYAVHYIGMQHGVDYSQVEKYFSLLQQMFSER